MANIVHAHGSRQPTHNVDLINDQIYKGHKYYNAMVEIERKRRHAIKAVQTSFADINAAQQCVDTIKTKLSALHQQKKLSKSKDKKTASQAPGKGEIAATKQALKEAAAVLRNLKKLHKEELKSLYEKANEEFGSKSKAVKNARDTSGVFWGTYLKIDQFFQQACNAKVEFFDRNGKPKTPPPWEDRPAFRSWIKSGDNGLIAVQLQNGLPAKEVFTENDKQGQLRIDPLPSNAFDKSLPRGQRNKLQRTVAHMRIGSSGPGNRNPIWASFPIFLHRPIPENAVITWALLIRKPWRQGFKYRWEFQLVLRVPDPPPKQFGAAVAINLGWRKMNGGDLRVATWADSYGNTGGVLLNNESFRDRIHQQNSIQGYRDTAKNELQAFLISHGIKCQKWLSPKRYHRLQHDGVTNPEVQLALDKWAARDNHLWWYQRGVREGALRHRREIYRLFALEMAKRYKVLVIENYDIRNISEDEKRTKGPSVQRVEGAPSEARSILESTGRRLGCLILAGESKQATQKCHVCGCENPWDAAPNVFHTCVNGHTWDQDINNALNMLESAKPILDNPEALAEAYVIQVTPKPAKFAKAHKKEEEEEEEPSI